MSKTPPFAHLHLHSEHSPLDGACRMDRLMSRVKELGMSHVGLTDHGTMSGLLKFQNAAEKAGVKPVLGLEAYFTEDRFVKDPKNRYYHLTLLAETDEGYENLCRLSALSNKEDAYYFKPRLDYSALKEHGNGIIVLTGCMAGRTMQRILEHDYTGAHEEVKNMMECVGDENVYVEVQDVGVKSNGESQADWNRQLKKIAKDLGRPLIGTGDVHYLTEEDANPHDAMLCVQMKTTIDNPSRMSLLPNKYFLRSPEQMMESLKEFPESLPTSIEIAERCNARIKVGRTFELLPTFPLPVEFKSQDPVPTEKPPKRNPSDEAWKKEWEAFSFLKDRVFEGIEKRYGKNFSTQVQERADFELSTILNMGVTDYFLIIWDLMRESHERKVPTGPGRGSGAGSIVLYALDVTQLDPLHHGLLFERFLNPDRISMPDVDLDFSPDRRKEMMEYMREKYGDDYVSQIITFGRIGSKAGIRRGAQAMGKEYLPLADKIAKSIPTKGTQADPLDKAMEESHEFRQAVGSSEDAKRIFGYAKWMEGMIQNEGVHAAALVVSPLKLNSVVPIQKAKDGNMVSAFDMKDSENVGLLKLDFLGLRNLDVIAECERLINKYREENIKAWEVPIDDKKTFEMLGSGNSIGVFQFECLSADTIINGEERTTIEQMYHNPPQKLLSIDLGEGKRKQNKVLKIVKSGEKQLYRLSTQSGYTLRASADHKILTALGWKKMIDLSDKDQIVVNRKDASRIGACTDCNKQTKSRRGKCTSCRNIERKSGQTMSKNRNEEKWRDSLPRGVERWGRSPQVATFSSKGLDHNVRSHWEADLTAWECPLLPDNFEFENICSVQKDKIEMTYDICMQAPLNNYIANGIVVHNSSGMADSLKSIGADQFSDLVAIVALYRPGPMASIPVYARRKKGIEPIIFGDPRLESILGETQGIITYQEQSMLVSRELAGFTPGEADTLRKAIGKKNHELMAQLKPKFVEGCKKNNVPKATAEELWASNEASAEYSFNKCLHGDTRVELADGSRMRLSKAYKERPKELLSMWSDGTIRPHKVKNIAYTGIKPLYRIVTKEGKKIRVTAEHRLLTTEGYLSCSELKPGMELITRPKFSEEVRKKRSAVIKEIASRPKRKLQDQRVSERIKEHQTGRSMEDKVAHMKKMHQDFPELAKNGTKAMHERIAWLRENDSDGVQNHTQSNVASVRAIYDNVLEHCSIASNEMWCASKNKQAMHEWLLEKGVEFEMHKALPNGRICDFYFHGIYWEMDGMDRTYGFFKEKYGNDLQFVIVTPEDYKSIVAKYTEIDHTENGDPITLIEYWGEGKTYDIEMENDGPKNFIANGIVSHNSHAAAYALVSYVTAYLKANYPEEYMAALLSSVMSSKDKVPFYLYETKKMGINVLAPDVNASFSQFEPAGKMTVQFGLTAIKGVGELIVNEIAAERERNGNYKSIWDFTKRVDGVNRREIDALIKAGAFDSTGNTRKGLLEVSEQALKQAKSIKQKESSGQSSLFDVMSTEDAFGDVGVADDPVVSSTEWGEMEKFQYEREVAGIYVSGHPLQHAQSAWERVRHAGIGQLGEEHIGRTITIAGIITGKRVIFTKRDNKKMLIITLEDLTGAREIVVFPKTLESQDVERILSEGSMVAMRVSIQEDDRSFGKGAEDEDDEKSIRMSMVTAFPFEPDTIEVPEYFSVTVNKKQLSMLSEIKEVLGEFPGTRPVKIRIVQGERLLKEGLISGVSVEPSEKLVQKLNRMLQQ